MVSQSTVSAGVSESFRPVPKDSRLPAELGSAKRMNYQGMIFFTPLFFLLDDSFPAGVHGGVPSFELAGLAAGEPFLGSAGQGGGVAESVFVGAGVPAPGAPVVAGCADPVGGGFVESPDVPFGGVGTIAVLPSRAVICRVPVGV